MEYKKVMEILHDLGTEQNQRIYRNHGCDIDMFGVSIGNLKKVLKSIDTDSDLGFQLLRSGNADAIYLAQWLIDSSLLTVDDIFSLIDTTNYYLILENVIPSLLINNRVLAWELLPLLIDHKQARYRTSGYSLYSLILGTYTNEEIDISHVHKLVGHIALVIHDEENRVKYSMNSFLISAGIYLPSLTERVRKISEEIGKVSVNMGKTSCKVPYAPDYIDKVIKMKRIGKKRK